MLAPVTELATAVRHHQAGRLQVAEQIYRQILESQPRHADALHLLGVIQSQVGRHDAAITFIGRAIAANPDNAAFHSNLGIAFRSVRQTDEAVSSYRRALQLKPDYAEAHNNLGIALAEQGKWDEASHSYGRALMINSNYAEAHLNLGNVHKEQRRFEDAIRSYERALRVRPNYAAAHYNLGIVFAEQGQLERAAACYRKALRLVPNYADAFNNLGNVLKSLGQFSEAVACYQQALRIHSQDAEVWNNLGNTYRDQGDLEQAIESYRGVLRISPQHLKGRLSLGDACKELGQFLEAAETFQRAVEQRPDEPLVTLRNITLCPPVFQSNAQIDYYRAVLREELARLADVRVRIDPKTLTTLACEPPFNLVFHGRNDREIKEAFANLFRAGIHCEPPRPRSGRPRIGFVVTRGHERAFNLCLLGILKGLHLDQIELVVVCAEAGAAPIRAAIAADDVRVLTFSERFEQIIAVIREARFDVLYHWEVGTDVVNYFLPFFRLAPVQCTAWGLPVTSGIREIDYFLSSELVEPENAEIHYTEKLLTFRSLLTYQRRVAAPKSSLSRESFGIPAGRRLYLCAQQLGKCHPDFDVMLAGILRRDPFGIIAFVKDPHGYCAGELQSRFVVTIPDVTDRIRFLPRQSYPDYLGLLREADVLLDTPHFNGGVTTFDALSLNRPVVTLPSEFRRGRLTYGCYQRMGITDCIAADPDDYADIAVRLAVDSDFRHAMRQRIRDSSEVLFEDSESVREHRRIIERLVGEARSCR